MSYQYYIKVVDQLVRAGRLVFFVSKFRINVSDLVLLHCFEGWILHFNVQTSLAFKWSK